MKLVLLKTAVTAYWVLFTTMFFVSCDKTPQETPLVYLPHTHYSIDLYPDFQSRSVRVAVIVDLHVPEDGMDRGVFYLNKGMQIKKLVSRDLEGYRFDRSTPGNTPLAVHSGSLYMGFKGNRQKGDMLRFMIAYDGVISAPDSLFITSSTGDRFLLNRSSGWFPINSSYNDFTYEIRVHKGSEPFTVFHPGKTKDVGDYYLCESVTPGEEIALLLSKRHTTDTVSDHNRKLTVIGSHDNQEVLHRAGGLCLSVMSVYSEMLQKELPHQILALVTSQRPDLRFSSDRVFLIHTQRGSRDTEISRTISEQIGRLYFNAASSSTWNEWLNVSFVEYLRIIALKRQQLPAFYQEIASKKLQSATLQPMWDFDVPEEISQYQYDRNMVLMQSKGVLLLHYLSERIGESKFLALCRMMIDQRIRTTDEFLLLLQQESDAATAAWFKMLLKSA